MKGIGIDIIEIERVREAVENFKDKFLSKVFTPHEIKRCTGLNKYRIPELAVRFAAKEAYSKALGTGIAGFGHNDHGVKWTDIEIRNDKLGKPLVAYMGKIDKKTHISLSHSREYAVASVVIGKKPEFVLPKRLVFTNKGDYGRVLIVAGSRNMSGAAYLTARAAIRAGAGLVYLAVPKSIQKIVAPKTREVITIGLPETKDGTISLIAFNEIIKIKADVAAIGPGLTTHCETKELVKRLILALKVKTMILDADGLNAIADDPSILKKAKSKIVITPHPGEMSRLIGKSIKQIQKDRASMTKKYAKKWGITIVLKGANSIVATSNQVFINSSGNPGMASAGVGDVLTGMAAAFIGQKLPLEQAVFLHGVAGDLASAKKGEYGMIASDLIEQIPYAIQKYS